MAQSWEWSDDAPRSRPRYRERYVEPPRAQPAWSQQGRSYRRPPPPPVRSWFDDDDDDDVPPPVAQRQRPAQGPELADGGPRIPVARMSPSLVQLSGGYAPGTIVIEQATRQLFLVRSAREAYRYPISVGREGFSWTGSEKVSRIADWPDWHPPAEMRKRDPRLPEKMTGGVRNPLGAKAIYLGNSLYRIHGTNDASSIGRAASSGCFRMMNGHVVDLASRVSVGATVVVVNRLPRQVASE